jgi:hypothetical protein
MENVENKVVVPSNDQKGVPCYFGEGVVVWRVLAKICVCVCACMSVTFNNKDKNADIQSCCAEEQSASSLSAMPFLFVEQWMSDSK